MGRERADRNRAHESIEADALRYDDAEADTAVFTGRVVRDQRQHRACAAHGSKSARTPQGYQYGTVMPRPDGPAFFGKSAKGVDEFIEGEGDTIEYDGKADTVTFTQNAQLRRYRGTALVRRDYAARSSMYYDNHARPVSGGWQRWATQRSGAASTGLRTGQ